MIEVTPFMLALVPVIVGLVQLYKRYAPAKFAPLVALFLGIIAGLYFSNADVGLAIVNGLVVGLTASGLYSQGKAVIAKKI